MLGQTFHENVFLFLVVHALSSTFLPVNFLHPFNPFNPFTLLTLLTLLTLSPFSPFSPF